MKTKILSSIIFVLSFIQINASEHGIYLKLISNIQNDLNTSTNEMISILKGNGFNVISVHSMATPDKVNEDQTELCGFNANLILFSSDDYSQMLVSYGAKYHVASFLKLGLYETPEGVQINITDPETINRIVFNDLYINDEEAKYEEIVSKTISFKKDLVETIHLFTGGEKLQLVGEPIRSDEDLMEASKDMFMMVGSMTFYDDEDQFPIIKTYDNEDGFPGLVKLKETLLTNMSNFKPTQDDIEYRWTKDSLDLNWKVIGELTSPDSMSILLGLTRPRTEGVSFYIVGDATDSNSCPGLDHMCAYPIEVLLLRNENEIDIYTAREMFRMDMYFWDAGMGAFMNHMSMPGILDESIRSALLGTDYVE